MAPASAAAPRPGVPPRRRPGGFTLVEVLVALAIVATAALAAQQAGQALLRTAERQPAQWLAQLCAHNAQVVLRLEPAFPPPGTRELSCTQGGVEHTVQIAIDPTPNPSFRRVEVRVRPAGSDLVLTRLTTVLGRH
ncbi:Type II secretion system protein I [Tepidimonas fonticaldi]|uniref:Type II secretion system protein I n=1 Tax=Tepidimonas fonticaldi TaxID=1101373 RepID=A0A554XQ30_9BURK|nr:type II secretion system minor pseudopilin GspI [Tepidimonas fonticaldi]TSE37892.1 Type II secretion system protein I [Tepidimonas fonticaldi]